MTLVRSYQDRKAGVPGSEKALGDNFDKGANVWEVLDKGLSWQDINTMVRIYQRLEAVDKSGALWRDYVKYLVRAYTSGVYGLEMVYTDRAKLRAYLDTDVILRNDAPKLARGIRWTQCMHENTDGWREVSDTDQLHINIANIPDYRYAEDTHIDETSFTDGRDEKGNSVQAWTSGPGHFAQSWLTWIDLERPFPRLEAILQAKEADRPLMTKMTASSLKEWSESRGANSVSGETGHKAAVELWRQIEADDRLLRPEETPAPPPDSGGVKYD